MTLAAALGQAAAALPQYADAIWPANGDPARLLAALDPEAACALLMWLLEQQPAAGEELLRAWVDLEAGAAPIAAVDPARLSKSGRKALGRVLHRLRSRGVSLPEAGEAPVVASPPEVADDFGSAFMAQPNPAGVQIALCVQPDRESGRARIYVSALAWEQGLLDFRSYVATRSDARQTLREFERSAGVAAVAQSAWETLLVRAAERGEGRRDKPLPDEFLAWREQNDPPAPGIETPGELARRALEAELPAPPARRELTEVAEWVETGRLGPWPPPPDQLERFAQRIRGILASEFLLNPEQRRRQAEATLGDLVEERYAGGAGHNAADCLDHTAYVFWKRRESQDAICCLAAARAFRELPPRDNPVARALLARGIDSLMEGWREREAESPIVRP